MKPPVETAAARPQTFALARPWPFVLAVWGGSRLFFLVAGELGTRLLLHAFPAGWPLDPGGFMTHWARWDGGWYCAIAQHGYGGDLGAASTAFFPLYPALLAIGGGRPAWGVALSLAASLAAFFFLYRIAEDGWGERVARAATLTLAFFPTALFLNAVYTEALFLALATGAVWAMRVRRNVVLACMFAYFASATRNVGVFLVIPLVWEWWRTRREHGRDAPLFLALAPTGLAMYMLYLWRYKHEPLLFAVVNRTNWGRRVESPHVLLPRAWHSAIDGAGAFVHPERMFATASPDPSFAASSTWGFALLVVVALMLALALRRLPIELWLYSFTVILVPLLTPPPLPLMSDPRYFLAGFPLFIALGSFLARRRALLVAWLALSASLGVYLTLEFVTWRWVA